MKTVIATGGLAVTDPDAFRDVDMPVPAPGDRDLLVRIDAVAVNPVDTKVFERLTPGTQRVLGWDACGVVQAVGTGISGFAPGQRVYYAGDLGRSGTNAEYQLVDARLAAPAPASLTPAQAAALPLTSLTAWEGLFDRLGFTPEAGANTGRTLLVIGGAGGVGSMLVQLGAWAGLTVIATAGRPESAGWCISLGAAHVIGRGDLPAELARIGIPEVDAIFCTTHMEQHWAAMASVIAPQGSICLIDDPSGPLDITLFKSKAVRFCWEFMFTRSMYATWDIGRQGLILARVARLVDEGTLRTTLGAEPLRGLSAATVRLAHQRQRNGDVVGKQVIAF